MTLLILKQGNQQLGRLMFWKSKPLLLFCVVSFSLFFLFLFNLIVEQYDSSFLSQSSNLTEHRHLTTLCKIDETKKNIFLKQKVYTSAINNSLKEEENEMGCHQNLTSNK